MKLIQANIKEGSLGNKRFPTAIVFLSFMLLIQISCKKFVEVPPPSGLITGDFVYTTDATAISVLTDLYRSLNAVITLNASNIQGSRSISLFAGLASDEYKLNGGITDQIFTSYYFNKLAQTSNLQSGADHWKPLYNLVFKCNAAIEGLSASKTLTPLIQKQLLGEAKFMRAFFYFYLVNMYGDVPLALTTDPETNTLLARSSKTLVYEQIKKDLLDAKDLLNDSFLDATLLASTTERVRPTKWAAAALLARIYLYNNDWANAEAQSALVLNNTSLFSLPTRLNDVFLKNSAEAIWQVQPTDPNFNTREARTLIIPSTGPDLVGPNNPVQLSPMLLSSFEPGDQRAVNGNWINSVTASGVTYRFPFKYKIYLPNTSINNGTGTQNLAEYFMVLRLAEQYLIRSEARAHLNNIGGAQSDLNTIRHRAGLGDTPANDQASLLTAILNERQHELFSEWGHRWFDLKRTGNIDAVMSAVTPVKSNGTTQWQSYQQWYPIPFTELQKAPNLVQNSGY